MSNKTLLLFGLSSIKIPSLQGLLLFFVLSSCVCQGDLRNKLTPSPGEGTVVTLDVNTRVHGNDPSINTDTEDNEDRVNTLRILFVRSSDGAVVSNKYYNLNQSHPELDTSEGKVRLKIEIPANDIYDIYLVANEAAADNYTNASIPVAGGGGGFEPTLKPILDNPTDRETLKSAQQVINLAKVTPTWQGFLKPEGDFVMSRMYTNISLLRAGTPSAPLPIPFPGSPPGVAVLLRTLAKAEITIPQSVFSHNQGESFEWGGFTAPYDGIEKVELLHFPQRFPLFPTGALTPEACFMYSSEGLQLPHTPIVREYVLDPQGLLNNPSAIGATTFFDYKVVCYIPETIRAEASGKAPMMRFVFKKGVIDPNTFEITPSTEQKDYLFRTDKSKLFWLTQEYLATTHFTSTHRNVLYKVPMRIHPKSTAKALLGKGEEDEFYIDSSHE